MPSATAGPLSTLRSEPLRILYIAHRIPFPPNKGDKIRAFHQLRHLTEHHEVDLFTLVDEPDDMAYVGDLERICASVTALPLSWSGARLRALRALASGKPFSPAYFAEPQLQQRISAAISRKRYDLGMLFCTGTGELRNDPGAIEFPWIADYCDLDSAKWAALAEQGGGTSLMHRAEATRLGRYETSLATRCRRVIFATQLEADDFLTLRDRGPVPPATEDEVAVIANGVDHDYFAPDRGNDIAKRSAKSTIVFTGAMDYQPNYDAALWFIENVWPQLRARGDHRLNIVGRQPPRQLAAYSGRDGIEVTGSVPDIRPYLHGASIAVAPLRVARGVQNKVLEAMATATPTVISPAVARGIEARPGEQTVVAHEPAQWVHEIESLLHDRQRRTALADAGHNYVTHHHDWKRHGDRLLSIVSTVAAESSARRMAV